MMRARVLITAVLLSASASAAHGQLSIDRGEMLLRTTGDAQSRAGILTVRNDGAARVQGSLTLEDWDRDSTGGNRFYPHATLSHSCKDAIQVFPATLNLAPGESQQVRVEYVGSERAAECSSLVVVEEARASAARNSGITVNTRMGLKVYVTPATSAPGGEVTDMAVISAQAADTSPQVRVTFHNGGTRHVKASGRLEIRTPDNAIVTSVALPPVYALGGAQMQTRAALPKLLPGRYILLAIYDFGGADLAAAQLDYEVAR